MCKWHGVIPRHKQSPHYLIAHGWKDDYGCWTWILLKLLMHLESQGDFIFFSLYMYTYSFFLLPFFFLSSLFFFFLFKFFNILPLNSRLHCTYLLPAHPMPRRLHVLRQRGGNILCAKVGTKSPMFSGKKLLKSYSFPSRNLHVVLEVSQNHTSILGTFILVIFLEIFIHTQELGCCQGGKYKKDILGL
jgi:hypothetical protein